MAKNSRVQIHSFLYVQAIASADSDAAISFRHTVVSARDAASAYAAGQAWSDANAIDDAQLLNDYVVDL